MNGLFPVQQTNPCHNPPLPDLIQAETGHHSGLRQFYYQKRAFYYQKFNYIIKNRNILSKTAFLLSKPRIFGPPTCATDQLI
jgi:hypothetical protein